MSFNSLGLSDALLKPSAKGYTNPSQYNKSNTTHFRSKDVLASTNRNRKNTVLYFTKYYRKETLVLIGSFGYPTKELAA
jgi:hypothetical protein